MTRPISDGMEQTFALLAGLMASASPADTLEPYRWEARPILVFADPGDPRLDRQMAEFGAAREALRERRNVVVVDTNAASALRERFGPRGFTVILVGLDGGEKARRGGVVPGDIFNDEIDAMPMRRRELERQ